MNLRNLKEIDLTLNEIDLTLNEIDLTFDDIIQDPNHQVI